MKGWGRGGAASPRCPKSGGPRPHTVTVCPPPAVGKLRHGAPHTRGVVCSHAWMSPGLLDTGLRGHACMGCACVVTAGGGPQWDPKRGLGCVGGP